MQRKIVLLFTAIAANCALEQADKQHTTFRRCFVRSTFIMLGKLLATNKPDFVQLNFGYSITLKDAIFIEAIIWKYAGSLGIPFMTYHLGYQFQFFKNCFLIKPSIAIPSRPIYTRIFKGFTKLDSKWAKFFFGRLKSHFPINF